MSVGSVEFLLALALLSAAVAYLPGVRARQALVALASAGFLYTQGPTREACAVLAAFLLSGYGCALLLRARPSRALLAGYLAALVAAFVALKRYVFVTPLLPAWVLEHPIAVVGLSYILFRQIHFVVDAMQGQIERPSLWTYLNYQLNAFTLIAGPIERYQHFAESWDALGPALRDHHEVLRAYRRVFLGMIKLVLVSSYFLAAHQALALQFRAATVDGLVAGLPSGVGSLGGAGGRLAKFMLLNYYYMLFLYFNFSGYCDAAIAGAGLSGLRLPENFDRPFLSRNILDFWGRWHITLGHWIRDYLFTPLYKAGVERWPRRAATAAVVGYLVAFTLAGLWHGSTWNFLIYGLLHGVGASAAKLWEVAILRRSGRPGLREYLKNPWIRGAAIFGTFNYACFTLFFFAFDLGEARRILAAVLGAWPRGY